MKKIKNKLNVILKISSFTAALLVSLSFFGCNALQDSLHDDMQKKLDEETGIASVDGDTWYFNGSSTSDVSGSENTSLLIKFSKKVAIGATANGVSKLSGTLTVNYISSSAEKTEVYPISKGKIKFLRNTDPKYEGVELGSLNASGTAYRLDMTPVIRLLTGKEATDNKIDAELKLMGFVSDAGNQKGRTLGTFTKKIKIRPLYEDVTISPNEGTTYYTKESSEGRDIVIPTNAPVSLAEGSKITITPSDASIKATWFSFVPGTKGFSSGCFRDLKDKEFTMLVKIEGIVPVSSGSSYTQEFKLIFTPQAPITKKATHTGDNTLKQLFTKEDMSVYTDYKSIVVNLVSAEWLGANNNWWLLYTGTNGSEEIGGNTTANWTGDQAELIIDKKWFEKIHENGIYIKADPKSVFNFTVTYK